MNIIEQITKHFEENRKPLLATAQRRLGDLWAEDAVQDAYERAIRYKDGAGSVLVMDAYIKRILENVILRYEREQFDYEEVEEWMQESGELADEFKQRGMLCSILGELEEMPEPQKSAVYMHVVQGESLERVSKILQITVPALKHYANNFREEMRRKYGEGEGV